jgi:hypothetical protein
VPLILNWCENLRLTCKHIYYKIFNKRFYAKDVEIISITITNFYTSCMVRLQCRWNTYFKDFKADNTRLRRYTVCGMPVKHRKHTNVICCGVRAKLGTALLPLYCIFCLWVIEFVCRLVCSESNASTTFSEFPSLSLVLRQKCRSNHRKNSYGICLWMPN